jgi:NAD+ synthase
LDINLSIEPNEISTVIKDFIKTYVKNSGCKGVVIGLSGGVDSALVALLCRQVLGKKNTRCVFLPDDTTPKLDFRHLDVLVNKIGLFCVKKEITNLVNEINKNCFVKPDKFALANVKTKARMIILYEYANMTKNLVCGTSNKSELLIGYFTKYGDGAVDIQPIGDLYKTQVLELAKHLKIPKEIISKPPTAGLWKGQTDEKELQISYKYLDIVLAGLELKMNFDDIAKTAGVKTSDVKRINNMRVKSQHKRGTPLIPKIGIKTVGIDWRSPVQQG